MPPKRRAGGRMRRFFNHWQGREALWQLYSYSWHPSFLSWLPEKVVVFVSILLYFAADKLSVVNTDKKLLISSHWPSLAGGWSHVPKPWWSVGGFTFIQGNQQLMMFVVVLDRMIKDTRPWLWCACLPPRQTKPTSSRSTLKKPPDHGGESGRNWNCRKLIKWKLFNRQTQEWPKKVRGNRNAGHPFSQITLQFGIFQPFAQWLANQRCIEREKKKKGLIIQW